MNDERSCQFCYYEYFDGKAYPCSMCIRGEERTDKFEPKGRQTKQTEPNCETCKHNKLEWYSDKCDGCSKAHSNYEPKGESDD